MCGECKIVCKGKEIGTIEDNGSEIVIKRTKEGKDCFKGNCLCNEK
ncbi:MAG: hypothetical protein PVJ67_02885 [Candidatus Pacearchaeota archaeon]